MSNQVNIREADDSNFQEAVLQGDGVVVVDFWAPWCGPCRMQGPILESFGTANPSQRIVKVNVDEARAVAMQYRIQAIPTIGVFKDGKLVNVAMGVQTEDRLAHLVQEASAA